MRFSIVEFPMKHYSLNMLIDWSEIACEKLPLVPIVELPINTLPPIPTYPLGVTLLLLTVVPKPLAP